MIGGRCKARRLLPLPRLRGRNAREARQEGASRQTYEQAAPPPGLPRKRGRGASALPCGPGPTARSQTSAGRPAAGS